MKLTNQLNGLDDLRKALSGIADETALRGAVEAGAEDVGKAAQQQLNDGLPPESRSGALARSLIVEAAEDGKSARIGTPLDYGWHLEMGSLNRPAMPWLEPAFNDSRSGILSRIRSWLANSARRARR